MSKGTHEAIPDVRNESVLIYVNGEFLERAEAKISVFDSAFLVRDGVWEGFRLHRGRFAHVSVISTDSSAAPLRFTSISEIDGNVATCNATDFFIVTGGEVWTSTGENCLNGITRSLVIELATAAEIPVQEKDFGIDRVYSAEEAFVTGTFGGLTPVVAVDGRSIGGGKAPGMITSRLTDSYRAAFDVAGEAS